MPARLLLFGVWAGQAPALPCLPWLAGMATAKLHETPSLRGLSVSLMPAAFMARVRKKRVSSLAQGRPGFTGPCCEVWLWSELCVCSFLGSQERVCSQSWV